MFCRMSRGFPKALFAFAALSLMETAAWAQMDLPRMDPGPAIGRAIASLDPSPTINNMFNTNPLPGRDFTHIHVRNSTGRKIYVAVLIVPFYPAPSSEPSRLSGTGGGGSAFETRAWYVLFQNQEAYVGDTNNNNVYTFANDDYGNQWAGNNYQQVYNGGQLRQLGFRWHLFGLEQRDFTINFQ